MYNEPLKEKVYKKLESLLNIYAKKIFVPCGVLEDVQYADCGAEHLRMPPAEGWKDAVVGEKWGGEWQNRWFKGTAKSCTLSQIAAV